MRQLRLLKQRSEPTERVHGIRKEESTVADSSLRPSSLPSAQSFYRGAPALSGSVACTQRLCFPDAAAVTVLSLMRFWSASNFASVCSLIRAKASSTPLSMRLAISSN
jgi:hypothetical protein